ncbi:MAG: T9SS type A sorting domain-containing protein [Bacteroidetes bacterium]|nr:T9SS type A sorting domain-containing protein [Bacteroidota bacterium]MDA1224688.1 T9SS type A sorting domain-containing protein [Bacteroidota bacterium]
MRSIFILILLLIFSQNITAQKALFVDDNGLNAANSDTMLSTLNSVIKKSLGITSFVHWNIRDSAGVTPKASQMLKYDLVIWYCSTDGVGLRIWNESTAGNQDLVSFIQSGRPVWIIGQDILYDQYAAPCTFKSGEFAYDYLGLSSYNVQSYVNDNSKGVTQLDRLNWSPASANFTNRIKWIFSELWYVDGCSPRTGIFELYKMGPEGYALEGAVSMFHNLSPAEKINVMSSFFDLALMDTYKNRVDFVGAGIQYMLKKTTEIQKQLSKAQWIIAPNPTSAKKIVLLNIANSSEVIVSDAIGKTIFQCKQNNNGTMEFSLQSLSSGFYWLGVKEAQGEINFQPLFIQ